MSKPSSQATSSSRGAFSWLLAQAAYSDAEKDWFVELQSSSCYWYDLIVRPPKFADTKALIAAYLRRLKAEVERSLEKRFIYFFASRRKVRFDTRRQPKRSLLFKGVTISLLVGRDQQRAKFRFVPPDEEAGTRLTAEVSDRFITLFAGEQPWRTWSVHDFLQAVGFNMRIPTMVHYVGLTKNPHDRPIGREHRGIADTLHTVSNEENDFFLFVNLFKPITYAQNTRYSLHFATANAMTDEVQVDEEGRVIEGALIAYFRCQSQRNPMQAETAKFSSTLRRLMTTSRIRSIGMCFEVDGDSDYYAFGSAQVPAASAHHFAFESTANGPCLTTCTSASELLERVQAVAQSSR
jgi:hypothetical protein